MVAGANKVFCGTENGVCELTKDTVYVHPSAKQCSWTPGSTPVYTRNLTSSDQKVCDADDIPISNKLYTLVITIDSYESYDPSFSSKYLTAIMAYSASEKASSVNISLTESIGFGPYALLVLKDNDGCLHYFKESVITPFAYEWRQNNENYAVHDITSISIEATYQGYNDYDPINVPIHSGYAKLYG